MYHCHIRFYLTGRGRSIFGPLRDVSPLETFTHEFSEGDGPDGKADVILAALWEEDAQQTARMLAAHKKDGAVLIALVNREQAPCLAELSPAVDDIWIAPLSGTELLFRFRKWQRDFKTGRDLWEANSLLDAVTDGSPNLIWFKTKDGIHERVNESFCETVGKTRQQIEGQRHAYIWNTDCDDPACIESEQEVMRRKETCVSDESIHTGNEEKLLKTYKSPLYDWDGSVMGTVGVAIDVTRERLYEQNLIEKNHTLEMLFSTMDGGVMCHSLDGRELVSINQAALKLLGYESGEELLADGFDLVVHSVVDEEKASLRRCIQKLQKAGDSVSMEYRVRHRDGRQFHILGNIKLIEEDGKLFYQQFLLDITAQKQREQEERARKDREIRYQERIFQIFSDFLADNIDDVYMMLDGTGKKVEFVSRNIGRVLGLEYKTAEDFLKRLGEACYLTGRKPDRQTFLSLQPGMRLEPVETERVHEITGEHKWFRESVYCVSVQNVKKFVVYISDRTAERRTQDALSEALEMAQVANKAKSTFLSNISHDIRTPMNAIMGLVTLLREETGHPERVLEYTQKISAASQHLLGLINDVLDMNKIESGSAMLNISELNLAEVIDEVNTIIRPQTRAKEQNFEIYTTHLAREQLLGDKLRINQILMNILSNAVKYTQRGGCIKMWVSELPQVSPEYSRIRFSVNDNGQGMSEEYLKRIFDPFTREQNMEPNKIQGTGLGMAITKSLVDLMGGVIRVSSKLGEGSTFTVELDLRIQKYEDDPGFWKKYHISRMIVADDDEEICRDIVGKMAATGVTAEYAVNGNKAIRMLRTARESGRPYDLILLDWKMPDLDGLETARLIRERYPEKTPILLFTAYDWNEIEQDALEVGVDHFLPKPFFMSNFKETVARMMGARKTSAPEKESELKGKKVLVVDDIEINRMILVKILRGLGAVCEVAENGKEAVERFLSSGPGEFDIILMDIQMPVMNGYEATRRIRASRHVSAKEISIIAMTANAFVDDIRNALEAGMDAHVAKPVVLDQLKRTIQNVLEQKKTVDKVSVM